MAKDTTKLYQLPDEYQANFSQDAYLKFYTSEKENPLLGALHKAWLDTFASGALQGKRLLDFGCGPCINLAIPSSHHFDELYLCDYVPENRQAVQNWIDKKATSHNWEYFLKLTAEIEGDSIPTEDIATRVRQKIKQVFHCDTFKLENPFHPNQFEPGYFDCIVSNMVLDTACATEEHFESIVTKLATYIKSGGHLALGLPILGSSYRVQDVKFFVLSMEKEWIEKMVRKAGFEQISSTIVSTSETPRTAVIVTGVKQ